GRRKYVHVASVAPSMALTPPQPDPPRHPTDSPAVAVEVAGQRPALPRVQGAALPLSPRWLQQQPKKLAMIG
ncbi:hypothetical protein, partial [Stenotrophomonas maltophilia]|uniref:hypothetical protein n=1 Tax=Stenotrophomonas maltophilia TaxID=40324 RepID=UPI002ACC5F26